MHHPKWTIFYDFHTQPAQPDVGDRFDVDQATDKWKQCGVDYVVFHARCNMGMAYYDTKVGIRHPSLKYDLFGKLAESCKKKGIALTAYLNAGLSHEEGLLHRDWLTVTPEGYVYRPNRMNNFMRRMCYNSPYGDHLVEMVREVATAYPIAGFFLDCMAPNPCVGVECVREMKKIGVDWDDEAARNEFARKSQVRLAGRIRDAALAVKPDLLLYFNGVHFEDQAKIGNYLEYECLPTGGWGYELLPAHARYARTLGKPVLNMTGRFHSTWGDFGGIRTEASLEYDCIAGLGNGLLPSIGDHWHPRGDINLEVFGLIQRVYGRLQALEPWLEGAEAAVDTAVVAPRDFHGETLGAVRLLAELKVQFDVVTENSVWKDYRLLVIPDSILFGEALAQKVRAHLDRGGAVLSSGYSGLDPLKTAFRFDDWGLKYEGEEPMTGKKWEDAPSAFGIPAPAYFRVDPSIAEGLPDMPMNGYLAASRLAAVKGTELLGHLVSSYFPRHWDGEHHHVYIPPDRETTQPFIARRGQIIHLSQPVFSAYHQYAPVPLKQLVANLLKRLHPSPLLRCENLPSFGRVTVTRQQGRRMVYVMNYVPERRGQNIDMIEETIESRGVKIALKHEGHPVRKAYLAPSGVPLSIEDRDGYAHVTLPIVKGWAVAVFEDAG